MSCAKYFLFITNFVVWIASVVMLGVALFVHMDVKEVVDLFPGTELKMFPISVIVAGCALFVVSFSGCCGAIKEWKWMLSMYLVFLLIIIGAEAYFAYLIMDFQKNDKNFTKVKEWVTEAFLNHKKNSFGIFENLFHCCGLTGSTDYSRLGESIPARCCEYPAQNTCPSTVTYAGCGQVFADYIEKYSNYAGYGMIAVGAVELMAVIAALFMICARRNQFQRV